MYSVRKERKIRYVIRLNMKKAAPYLLHLYSNRLVTTGCFSRSSRLQFFYNNTNRREIATNIDITMIYSYSRHHFKDSEHQLYIDIPCILPSRSGLYISGQKHSSCGLFQACDMCAILISQTLQLHIHVIYIYQG